MPQQFIREILIPERLHLHGPSPLRLISSLNARTKWDLKNSRHAPFMKRVRLTEKTFGLKSDSKERAKMFFLAPMVELTILFYFKHGE